MFYNFHACGVYFRWGYNQGGLLQTRNQTDSGFSFALNYDCEPCDPEYYEEEREYRDEYCNDEYVDGPRVASDSSFSTNCYDARVFVGFGEGRKASNAAFQQCITQYAPYVARFDCTGGQVAENYWDAE